MGLQGDAATSRGDIMRRLSELEWAIRDLQTARRLEASSISRGGLTVKGAGSVRSDNFDGDPEDVLGSPGVNGWALGASGLVANAGVFRGEVRSAGFVEGESGYRLDPSGDAEFNEIRLRDGIVGPSALSEQLRVVQKDASFGPTVLNSETVVIDETVTVPPWAATAAVQAFWLGSANQLAGDLQDRRFVIQIAGVDGTMGQSAASPAMQARTLTSPGSSFQVKVRFVPLDSPAEDFDAVGELVVQTIFGS